MITVLFCFLLAAVRAQAGDFPSSAHFPSVSVGGVAAGPEVPGWIYRPSGAGPFPTIVLAHTCAGYIAHVNTWGWLMAKWGYLVLAPDSFTPRHKQSVCEDLAVVSPDMRVPDIAGALAYLATRADVLQGHIGLIGHSHGGSTALRAVQGQYGLARQGLRGAVAYYPGCSAERDRDVAVPLLVLIGDKDDWMRAEWCRRLQKAGFERPELVEVVYYPNAQHFFDGGTDERVRGENGELHRLLYDPAAAPDAEIRTKAFFDRLLR